MEASTFLTETVTFKNTGSETNVYNCQQDKNRDMGIYHRTIRWPDDSSPAEEPTYSRCRDRPGRSLPEHATQQQFVLEEKCSKTFIKTLQHHIVQPVTFERSVFLIENNFCMCVSVDIKDNVLKYS